MTQNVGGKAILAASCQQYTNIGEGIFNWVVDPESATISETS